MENLQDICYKMGQLDSMYKVIAFLQQRHQQAMNTLHTEFTNKPPDFDVNWQAIIIETSDIIYEMIKLQQEILNTQRG